MRLVFFDTEFTDLCVDPRLISIGLVDITGTRSFYAEVGDTYCINDVGDFARAAVLPRLQGGDARMTMCELSKRLHVWLSEFGEPVQLATDSKAWDWPWIGEIFHEQWPDNLHGKPLLLTTPDFQREVEKVIAAHKLQRHHALSDAQANRLAWLNGQRIDQ